MYNKSTDTTISRKDHDDVSVTNLVIAWGICEYKQRTLSSVGPRWNHLVNVVEGRITELETIDAHAVFCDNSQHPRGLVLAAIWWSTAPESARAKTGTIGIERNALQCAQLIPSPMTETVLEGRCKSGTRLSHRTRAFPLKCLQFLLRNSLGVLDKHLASLGREKVIVIVNFRNSTFEACRHFGSVSITSYLANRPGSDCAQIDDRVETMVKDLVLNPSPDIFLFEVRLAWTRERALYVMAEVDMSHAMCKDSLLLRPLHISLKPRTPGPHPSLHQLVRLSPPRVLMRKETREPS
ncbi:hypothetical protein BKA70DRAFT_1412281 [Coprinopsis sp. MPI-PUGE-AT-0042]|nr:hypothetical protein BKA70DRAFT_1412281 [Coprinopsis sp. MPI-PUGE-AT-0042]